MSNKPYRLFLWFSLLIVFGSLVAIASIMWTTGTVTDFERTKSLIGILSIIAIVCGLIAGLMYRRGS